MMTIRLQDFDSLEVELGNGRTLRISTSRDGDLTRVRIDADANRPPIILRYLTGRDPAEQLEAEIAEATRHAAAKERVISILKQSIADLVEGDRHA